MLEIGSKFELAKALFTRNHIWIIQLKLCDNNYSFIVCIEYEPQEPIPCREYNTRFECVGNDLFDAFFQLANSCQQKFVCSYKLLH